MKLIAFFLAIFIGFLALQPCSDTHIHSEDEKHMHAENTHSHNSEEQDECTVFCICVCCGASIELVSIHFFEEVKEIKVFSTRVFGYTSYYKSYFSNNIWEPPMV